MDAAANRPPILIVEDNPTTLRITAKLTRERGFDVITAGSITEARLIARAQKIVFLISDIGLPDGDGCDLMADLRAQHGTVGVAITGYGMEGDIAKAMASGFKQHFTKPIHIDQLEKILALAEAVLGDARR